MFMLRYLLLLCLKSAILNKLNTCTVLAGVFRDICGYLNDYNGIQKCLGGSFVMLHQNNYSISL